MYRTLYAVRNHLLMSVGHYVQNTEKKNDMNVPIVNM